MLPAIATTINVCTSIHAQMHAFHKSCLTTNTRMSKDKLKTPQHKPYPDHFDRRQASSSGQPRHPLRSCSPSCRSSTSTAYCRSSPPPYSHSRSPLPSPSKQPFFQPAAGSKSPPVSALCLGREAHDILKC